MKINTISLLSFLALAVTFLSSCEVIGGIFKAGIWTGIIIVAIIVAVVIYISTKLFSKNKD